MSPTIPPVLVLSLLLVSPPQTAEAGELMDLLALIRGTLKYWRRVYHMYEEEVALGYCWAEYFLHLHGEDASGETATSSPGPVFDHAPHFHTDFGAGFANGFGDGVGNGAWNGWIVGQGYRRGKRSYGKDELSRIVDNVRGVYSKIEENGFEVVSDDEKYRRGKKSYGKDELSRIVDNDHGVYSKIDGNDFAKEWVVAMDNAEGYRRRKRSYGKDELSKVLDNDRGVYSKIEENGFEVVSDDEKYRRGKKSYGKDELSRIVDSDRGVYSKIEENGLEIVNDEKYRRGKRSYGKDELSRVLDNDYGVFVNSFGDDIENETWRGWIIGEDNGKDHRSTKRSYGSLGIWGKDRGVYSKIEEIVNDEKYRRGKRSYEASRKDELSRILDNVFVNNIENETWRGWIIGVDDDEDYRSNKRFYGSLGILSKNRSVYSKIERNGFGNETWNEGIGNYRRSKRSYDLRRDESLKILSKNLGVYSKIDENAFENNFEDGFGDGIENIEARNEWIKRSYGTSKRKDGSLGILDENRNVHSRIVGNGFVGRNDWAITANNKRKYRGNKTSYGTKEEEILETLESKDYNGVYSKIVKELVSGGSMSDESVLNFGDKKVFDDVRGKHDETLNFTKKEYLFPEKKHGSSMIVSMENGTPTTVEISNSIEDSNLKKREASSISKINLETAVTRLKSNKRTLIVSEKLTRHLPSSSPNKQRTAIERISRTIPRLTELVKKFPTLDTRFEADHANLEPNKISRTSLEQGKNENPSKRYEISLRNPRAEKRYSSGIPSSIVLRAKEIVSSRILGNDFAPGRGEPVPAQREETTKFRSNGVQNSGGSKGDVGGEDGEEGKVSKEGRLVDPEGITTVEEVWDGVGRERRDADEGGGGRQPTSGVRGESGKVKVRRKDEGRIFDSTMRGCRKGGFSLPIVPSSSANEEQREDLTEEGEGSRGKNDTVSSIEVGSRNTLGELFLGNRKHGSSSVSRSPDEETVASNSSFEKEGESWRGNLRRKRDANDDRTTRGASSPCNSPVSFREIRGSSKGPGRDVGTSSRRAEGVDERGETTHRRSKQRHDRRDVGRETSLGRHRGIRTASSTPDDPRGTVYSRLKNSWKDGRWKKRGGGSPRGEEVNGKQSSGDVRRDNSWYRGGENVVDGRGKSRKKSRIRDLLGGAWLPPPVVAYRRFTEDHGGVEDRDRSRWRAVVDRGRRGSSKAEARGLDRGDTALFYLRQAFMGFLRALGFFVNVGRQLMDYVESNGALACTKDYLVGKAIHWIDS